MTTLNLQLDELQEITSRINEFELQFLRFLKKFYEVESWEEKYETCLKINITLKAKLAAFTDLQNFMLKTHGNYFGNSSEEETRKLLSKFINIEETLEPKILQDSTLS
jgi:hypothetical protein